MLRPVVGVLTQNRRDPQRLTSRRGPDRGFLFDLMDQVKVAGSPDRLRKVRPAWEGRQVQRLDPEGRIQERGARHLFGCWGSGDSRT